MALQIKGIRLHNVWVGVDDDGKEKVTATYQLVTTEDKVIGSKESLSTGKGYNENTFMPAPETVAALKQAVALYKRDVELSLGLASV